MKTSLDLRVWFLIDDDSQEQFLVCAFLCVPMLACICTHFPEEQSIFFPSLWSCECKSGVCSVCAAFDGRAGERGSTRGEHCQNVECAGRDVTQARQRKNYLCIM